MRKRGDKKVKRGSGTRWVPDWMYAAMCKQSNRWHETLGLLFHFCLQQKRRHSCRSLHMPFVHGCPGWTLIPIFTSHVWLSGKKKKSAFYIFFTPRKQRISLSVMGNIFPSQSFCLPCIHISTMNINNIGLSRMSTIFCLLISISSLHKSFISLGTLVKGSSSLPWLISSQPHRSQAFPNQCSLCSHKDPRNPAACPQLIFPVTTLLTQPPTVRGCKCKGRNRLLCVHPQSPTSPPLAHSGVAKVSITLGG